MQALAVGLRLSLLDKAFEDYGAALMPILRKVGIDPGTPDVMPIHNLVG